MAYTIETRTVDGTAIFGFNPPALQGYWDGLTGSYDNIDQKASVLYEGSDWASILWINNDDELMLEVEGLVTDSTTDDLEGWDKIVINGNTFNRNAATTFTTLYSSGSNTYKLRTRWIWPASTSPFPNSTGVTVTWQHNGYAPTQGAISLNEIHQEAGGSSGTQGSINDADVRGKSWYARVAGSTPASGATQDFADFYYPRLFGASHDGFSYPVRVIRNGETTSYSTGYRSGNCDATYNRNGGSFSYDGSAKVGVGVKADGTNTYIYIALATQGIIDSVDRDIFDWGGTDRGNSGVLTEAYRIPGISCDQFAMYSVLKTSSLASDAVLWQNEDPTKTTDGNGGASWTGAAYVSANSITSFNTFSSTSAVYGRQFRIRTQTSDQDYFDSNITCHFMVRLRRSPTTTAGYWTRDIGFNLRCRHFVQNVN